MPLPTPTPKQTEDRFMEDCLSDDTVNKDFPKSSQRFAVCKSQWQRAKKKSKASWDEFKADMGGVYIY